ncbi:MAG: DNA-deoxyinosine glycosylase [Lachnospiraceae bacterium]|nr:DNA-deoxyinosine glycosylase [Lachnospiraceae bacterium]
MNESTKYQRLRHEFGPVFDENSRILILGSFPSVKSREQQFYYGHPQNRFWKVLTNLAHEPPPETVEEKKAFLLRNQIALWDVIAECDIIGSSDSSIRNVVPVDLPWLLERTNIERIYVNGGKAYELYQKYLWPMTGRKCERLPSTSPANAACTMDRLMEAWSVIAKWLRSMQCDHRLTGQDICSVITD